MARQTKKDVAAILLPIYEAWYKICVTKYDSKEFTDATEKFWEVVRKYPDKGIPTFAEADVGLWCAKQLGIKLTAEQKFYGKTFTGPAS